MGMLGFMAEENHAEIRPEGTAGCRAHKKRALRNPPLFLLRPVFVNPVHPEAHHIDHDQPDDQECLLRAPALHH